MKKQTIALIIILSLLIAGSSTLAGWLVANNQQPVTPETPEPVVKHQAEVYFYRTDGIYRVTSQNEKPEQLVSTSYDQDKSYYFAPNFELMGQDQNWLVYRDVIGKRAETNELLFGLMVYDLKEKKQVMSFKETDSSVLSFLVSQDKKQLVFVVGRHDAAKQAAQSPDAFYQELYRWNGNQPEKVLTEESGFYAIGLGIWLDNDHITIGKGYEGISFCKIDLNTATKIPDSCDGYGTSSMGTMDIIKTFADNNLYGYHYEWSEITGNRNTSQGIFKQEIGGQKTYLTQDVPNDIVVGKNDIYYLRSNINATKYIYNGVDTDLYLVAKDGTMTKRLTNDGTSVLAKSNLNISADQRYLTYQVTDISKINPAEYNTKTTQENSTIWVYDTQLNKYYQIAENGLAPRIVIKGIEN